ncbi:MAG: peptide deformylase [Alphaproteobacteria bacterium]
MALLPIITAPDPRLKRPAAPVGQVDAKIRRLLAEMLETMYAAPGIGLAGPQVGHPLRVVVVDVAEDDEKPAPLKLVNPEIVEVTGPEAEYEEGCLSLPDHYAQVVRPNEVSVRYLDESGAARELRAEAMLATCIQHEIDHLDGILFVDRVSAVRRNIILRKLIKAKKARDLPRFAELIANAKAAV